VTFFDVVVTLVVPDDPVFGGWRGGLGEFSTASMLHMELGLVAAEFESGQLYAEQLPGVATTLLASGADSPSLRIAAGADHLESQKQRELFRSALVELGALPLSDEEVGERLFRLWAQRIVAEAVSPLEGVRAMWLLEIDYGVVLPGTMSQYGALDDGDFATSDIEQDYESDIRAAATRWLEANPG
jgi:hypothetical protein